MTVIYKYTLTVESEQTLSLPVNSKILTLQLQKDVPCLWVELDPFYAETTTRRTFYTFGTGQPFDKLPLLLEYVGTYQLYGGNIVLHVYESSV